MVQQIAPGMHAMRLRWGGFTFPMRRYREEWECDGCGLLVRIKSHSPHAVNAYVQFLVRTHEGFMTDAAVLNRVGEAKMFAMQNRNPLHGMQNPEGYPETEYLFYKVWLKVDFTGWQLRVAHQVRRRAEQEITDKQRREQLNGGED
jgi:hypothetical protein